MSASSSWGLRRLRRAVGIDIAGTECRAIKAGLVGQAAVVVAMAGGMVIEGDSELYLDLPAADAYVFDEQPQELLALLEVELVDAGGSPSGEAATRCRTRLSAASW